MIVEYECIVCRVPVRRKRSPSTVKTPPKFCSQKCNGEARRGSGAGRRVSAEFACETCGQPCRVYRSPSARPARFCSLTCLGAAQVGPRNPAFVPGPKPDRNGYRRICVDERGPIYEHRWVMEQIVGRRLRDEEVVHHIDLDKANNSPSNLLLLPDQATHMRVHASLENS